MSFCPMTRSSRRNSSMTDACCQHMSIDRQIEKPGTRGGAEYVALGADLTAALAVGLQAKHSNCRVVVLDAISASAVAQRVASEELSAIGWRGSTSAHECARGQARVPLRKFGQ